MRYEDEGAGGRVRGAASRYDRWGTRRGTPYAADAAFDEPPGRGGASGASGAWTGGAGGGWAGSPNRWDGGNDGDAGADGGYGAADGGWDGGWDDGDPYAGGVVAAYPGPWLPPYVWARWRRRPWFPRLTDMLRRARPAGTLRTPSGARYPVFRGRMGGRGWRVVTRPRGGMRFEVVGLEAETGPENEMLSMADRGGAGTPAGFAPAAAIHGGGAGAGGYRLRLPHAGLHTILGRLRPEQLRALAGGSLPADPAAAVARGVGRVARRARRLGRFRGAHGGGAGLDVFGTPGFRLLVRPTGEMEGEILAVTPVQGEDEIVYADGQTGYRRQVNNRTYRVRGAHAQVTWSPAKPLSQVETLTAPESAVYVLLKGGKPIYVGETKSWSTRWKPRLQALSEFGFSTKPYKVAVGTIRWIGPGASPPAELLRNDVEHILVRGLGKKYKLNNRSSHVEILPPKGGKSFLVKNDQAPASFPRDDFTATGDTPYELER